MEIREPRSKSANPALDWSASSYSTAAKSLQLLAEDITNISAANFERNAKLIDDLRNARSVEDFVSIQTKFMTGMVEAFNDNVRLMGMRMAELRTGLVDNSSAATAAANDAAAPADGLSQVMNATNVATLANIKAGQEFTRSALEAAEKAADTMRSAFSASDVPPAKSSG